MTPRPPSRRGRSRRLSRPRTPFGGKRNAKGGSLFSTGRRACDRPHRSDLPCMPQPLEPSAGLARRRRPARLIRWQGYRPAVTRGRGEVAGPTRLSSAKRASYAQERRGLSGKTPGLRDGSARPAHVLAEPSHHARETIGAAHRRAMSRVARALGSLRLGAIKERPDVMWPTTASRARLSCELPCATRGHC
jgi:hypothetical protein